MAGTTPSWARTAALIRSRGIGGNLLRVQEVTKQSSNHSSRSQSPPSTTLSPSCSGWPSTSASWMTRSCSWCSPWPTSISRGGLGGPTVEIETDMFGGLHYLHGTHMRGWIFVYMYHLLKHPQCLNAGVTCTKAMAKAMALVAFLTCGPLVWRRICRNVRAAASLTLLVHITSEATWRRDRKEVSRGAVGAGAVGPVGAGAVGAVGAGAVGPVGAGTPRAHAHGQVWNISAGIVQSREGAEYSVSDALKCMRDDNVSGHVVSNEECASLAAALAQ